MTDNKLETAIETVQLSQAEIDITAIIEAIVFLPAGKTKLAEALAIFMGNRDLTLLTKVKAHMESEHESLTTRLEAVEAERDKWRLALEGLTPQGSEYHNDVKRCVDYVIDRLTSDHKRTVEEVKRRVAAEKENAELRAEVERLKAEDACFDDDDLTCLEEAFRGGKP